MNRSRGAYRLAVPVQQTSRADIKYDEALRGADVGAAHSLPREQACARYANAVARTAVGMIRGAAHGPAASILLCPGNIAREQVRLARLIAPIPSAPECLTT